VLGGPHIKSFVALVEGRDWPKRHFWMHQSQEVRVTKPNYGKDSWKLTVMQQSMCEAEIQKSSRFGTSRIFHSGTPCGTFGAQQTRLVAFWRYRRVYPVPASCPSQHVLPRDLARCWGLWRLAPMTRGCALTAPPCQFQLSCVYYTTLSPA